MSTQGKIVSIRLNGNKIPVGALQYTRNLGMVDRAIDCNVSYADIVSAELREVDLEVIGRSIPRTKYTASRNG